MVNLGDVFTLRELMDRGYRISLSCGETTLWNKHYREDIDIEIMTEKGIDNKTNLRTETVVYKRHVKVMGNIILKTLKEERL